jgi:hypothetical protein
MTSDRGRVPFDLRPAPGRNAARLARRRKGWCLGYNTSPDAPRMPACAPALRAALPDLCEPGRAADDSAAARIAAVALVMWNMKRRHSFHS